MQPNEIIKNALRHGENHAISRTRLAEITGLDVRDVSQCIEDMRCKGAVICSSSVGYFYPKTRGELGRHVHKEHSRADSILRSVRAADEALNSWGDDNP